MTVKFDKQIILYQYHCSNCDINFVVHVGEQIRCPKCDESGFME